MKKLKKLMLVLAQLGVMGAAQAASVSLSPASQPVVLGNNVSFNVIVDFTGTPTLGGAFQLSYSSSILGGASFSYDSSFVSANSLTAYTPTLTSGLITNLGFDSASFSGSGTLGTITFSTINTGLASVVTAADADPFYRFLNTSGSSLNGVTYGSATAEVSAVPVPAALWLMASGLSALGLGLRRRHA